MDDLLERIRMNLTGFGDYIVKKYVRKSVFQYSEISMEDANILFNVLKNHCKCIDDVRKFYIWSGSVTLWFSEAKFLKAKDMTAFWKEYYMDNKQLPLLYKIIYDLRREAFGRSKKL